MVRLLVIASTLSACAFHLPGGSASQDDGGIVPPDTMQPDQPPVTPAWAKKRRLTIDNTGLGSFASFPLAVILNATRIDYASTLPNGEDLRFSDASNTSLAYEIEQWQPGGQSIVWVNVPAIQAGVKTDIFMYYDNPQATDAQAAPAVWDASYVGVWHLADAHDSTGKLTSTDVGSTPIAGKLGPARHFDGVGQYIDTGTQEHLDVWTLEAWMDPGTPSQNTGAGAVVSGFPNYLILWNCVTSTFCHTVLYNDTLRSNFVGFSATVGRYSYVVGSYDGQSLRAFSDTTSQTVGSTGDPVSATATTKIANHANLNGAYLGSIDEVRISRIARSTDYVTAQLRSMSDAYVTYGPEEPN